jgi:hypothetical protein
MSPEGLSLRSTILTFSPPFPSNPFRARSFRRRVNLSYIKFKKRVGLESETRRKKYNMKAGYGADEKYTRKG